MKTNHFVQNYTQENLPEGAKVRLGKGSINDIQFSPDNTQLAVASSIGIWIYDTRTGEELNLLTGHRGSVSSIAYSPNGHLLASGSRDDTVRLWDAKRSMPLKTLRIYPFQSFGVYSVAFQNDGHILASGGCTNVIAEGIQIVGEEHGVFLWKAEIDLSETKHGLRTVPPDVLIKTLQHKDFAESVAFSSDGSRLASGSEDGTVRLWDTKNGELLKTLNMPESFLTHTHTKTVKSLAFCSDGRILASGGGGQMRLWDVERGKLLKPQPWGFLNFLGGPCSARFSPDGCILAMSSDLNNISLWDITTDKHLKTLLHTDMPNANVTSFAFSPDGRTLASGSQDGTVLLWDVGIAKGTPTSATASIGTGGNRFVPTEKNIESQNRGSQIRQICTERGITTLVHFTRIEHLQNILQEGLLGRSLLEARGQQFLPNDSKRLDRHKEAICLSISFPNDLLFSKFRYKSSDGNCSEWVVLLLDAKVLWELDCAFCQENAASSKVRYIPLEDRKKTDALKSMFVDVCRDTKGDVYERQSLQIPNHYPTHPQAEVLVFDPIPVKYIKEVHFYNETALEQWRYSNTGDYPPRLTVNQQYFQYGRDQIVCEDDNLDDDIPPAPPPEDDNLNDDIPF